MAISYDKTFRTVTFVMKDGTTTFEVADTESSSMGTAALGAFERGGLVRFDQTNEDEETVTIEFNACAVLYVSIEKTVDDVSYEDDTCVAE